MKLPDLLQRVFHQAAVPHGSRRSTLTLVLIILLGSGSGLTARAQELPPDQHVFEWEEAQSLAASAATPAAFFEAARHYNALAAEGVRNGDLFFNMGTCLLLAEQPKNAWLAFVRAERYLGRPPDLIHNMELARSAMNRNEPSLLPWDRTLLFLHFALPLEVRLRFAVICFFLFWIGWALAWKRVRGSAKAVLVIALAAALVFGSSAAVTLFQESQTEPLSLSQGGAAHATN